MIAPSYKLTAILFGIGVTLHNLEEAMFLAGWSRSHLRLRFKPSARAYWILTSLVSVVVWVPVVGVCVSKEGAAFQNAPGQNALSGFALAMAVNAVLPHLAISLVKHSYSPGLGTGMLFNLPLGVLLLHERLGVRGISQGEVWRAAMFYALLLAAGSFAGLWGAHAIARVGKK